MSAEIERREQPQEPRSIEPTPASQITKRVISNIIIVFFSLLLLQYLFPRKPSLTKIDATHFFFTLCAIGVIHFAILLGLDWRRVRRSHHH